MGLCLNTPMYPVWLAVTPHISFSMNLAPSQSYFRLGTFDVQGRLGDGAIARSWRRSLWLDGVIYTPSSWSIMFNVAIYIKVVISV